MVILAMVLSTQTAAIALNRRRHSLQPTKYSVHFQGMKAQFM